MSTIKITMIAAMCPLTRSIGHNDGSLPWGKIKEDFRHFQKTTMGGSKELGCPLIMGRKTFESFGSRPLPKRPHIILSRDPKYNPGEFQDGDHGPQVVVVNCIRKALDEARRYESYSDRKQDEVFVIGGGEIYKLFLTHADEIIISEITPKDKNEKLEAIVKFPFYKSCGFNVNVGKFEIEDPNYDVKVIKLQRP